MKKIIFGLILGLLLSSGIVYAAELNVVPNPFPVLINGAKAAVEGYNIDGSTYLKLADFKQAGLVVKFNETDKLIEITSDQVNLASLNTAIANEGGNNVSETQAKPASTPDGITTIDEYQGQYYIGIYDVKKKCIAKGYELKYNTVTHVFSIINGTEVILERLQTSIILDGNEVEYNYYVNSVMPLLL